MKSKADQLISEIRRLQGHPAAEDMDDKVVRSKLKMLLADKQYDAALSLIGKTPFSGEWAEEAIAVYAHNHNLKKAKTIFDDAVQALDPIDDKLKNDRLRRAYADILFKVTFAEQDEIYADNLSEEEISILEDIWETVSTLALEIVHVGITNKLHQDIVHYARLAAILLKKSEEAICLALALRGCDPIPATCAEDILAGRLSPEIEIVDQLRTNHADNFRVLMWCCRIEAERLQDFSGAFNNACCIATSGIEKSDSQKKELGRFLFGVSLLLDRFQQSEAMKLISQDLGLSGLPVALLKAHGLINRKENEQALIVLDEVREDGKEDPAWLGIYAQVLQSLGRNDEANACIVRQGEVMPLPELLKENALSLHEHGADDDAIQVLEKLLTEKPDDEYALYNLAVLYFHKGQIRQAIEWLNKLIKAKGLNDERRLFLAQTHFNLDEFDKVVEVLSPLCDKDPPLLEAVINSACALNHAQGPQSAFEFIKKYKDRFWNNPKFVGQYMTLAPAAGHEREMHLAMQQMMALDQASQGSTPMIQRIDLDEIKTMLKSSASQTRQWIDFEVQGIMPWIKRELMLNNAVYWGWRRRTYDCLWVMEDRYSRAENQIYVSNALNVQDGRAGTPELLPITLPEKNTDVVFDISALITLHELGFLEPAFDFFATVYLPVQYLAVSKQKNGLVPHQLSQLSFITEAKRLLVEQKIKPASDSSDVRRIVVDEYNPDDQVKKSAIGLAELLNYLREQGAFTEEQYEQIIRTVNRKRTSSESDLFDTPFVIQIALSSFGTLFHFKLHSALLECSEVCLSESDIDEVQRQSVAFDLQKATLEKHEHLWKWLHDHEKKGKLTFTSHTPCSELRDIISDEDRDIAFFSSSLARTKALPYCADDRACQLVGGVSFGTPQLLEALYEAKQITLQQYSEAFMRMIEWRYRFLLVPPEVMRFFAHSFKSALPGKELKKIAHYLHDCMRDEGLSSAQQPVEPPVPISMRYFMTWVSNIAEFLVDAWLDPDIEEKQLCLLTDWVAVEMLPSVPRTLKGVFHMRVGNLMQQTLISQLLIRSMTAKFPNRLDLAMSRIKSTLKISDETYTDIVTEVLRHVD